MILGVTSNFNAASLNDVEVVPSEVVWYGISSPWVTVADWLSIVNTFGFEIVFPNPRLSSAVISAFKTPVPVLLKIPIPLVAPVAAKSVRLSDADPTLATVFRSIPSALPELVPCAPPILLPPLK